MARSFESIRFRPRKGLLLGVTVRNTLFDAFVFPKKMVAWRRVEAFMDAKFS